MKTFFTTLSVAVSLFAPALRSGAEAPKPEPAQPFVVRDGLPNLAAKLQAGGEVRLVFLGGSITVNGGHGAEGYVNFVGDWLRQHYPQAKVTIFNAGIPGTGSDFGAKRYDRDVLAQKPDAVFVEFNVNDGVSDATVAMERIVHKTWQQNPNTDLLFFYTLADSHLASYQQGLLPPAASSHERVAAFYGIPSVGTARCAADKINSGAIAWKVFSADSCHPTAAGFKLFDEAFAAALPNLLKAAAPKPHALGKSITTGLQVYPPPLQAKPLDPQASFTSAQGVRASKVYPLPLPAVHWVQEPAFAAPDGKALWRLSWLKRSLGGKLDGSTGADKAQWEANDARWFEEGKGFTGPGSMTIFVGEGGDAARLSIADQAIPVLRFVAPSAGRYALAVQSGPFEIYQKDDLTVAMAALKFTWNGSKGELLKLQQEQKNSKKGLRFEVETTLAPGEELVLVPDVKAPAWLRGAWTRMKVVVAQVGE